MDNYLLPICVGVIVALLLVILFMVHKSNKRKNKENDKNIEIENDSTVSLYDEEDEDDDATISLWDDVVSKKKNKQGKYSVSLKEVGNEGICYSYSFNESFTIGRAKQGDLKIQKDAAISDPHCEIVRKKDGFYIKDLGSLNGTKLNNKKIASEYIKIEKDDVITIGRTSLKISFRRSNA